MADGRGAVARSSMQGRHWRDRAQPATGQLARDLFCAARDGDLSEVTRLLRIGVSAEVGATDSNANTSVGIATNRGHLEVVALLLSSSASANGPAFGNGSTPLMIAALWNRELIAATLLRHGGALEPRGSAGSYKDRTALDLARENGRARIVSLLVRTRATRVWERLRRIAPAAGAIPSARLMSRGSKIQA